MGDYSRLAGVLGAFAVAFGAFGAHGLKSRVTDEKRLSAWATGAQYHLIHSAAVLACSKQHKLAVYCFVAGIVLFSGSLYGYGATGILDQCVQFICLCVSFLDQQMYLSSMC
jgi:uncharacterized membrane protein YgdD (TMEM256/DUF423 family)